MKSFRYYITEIGDSAYPFKYEGSDDDGEYHHYSIKHPTDEKKNISVMIRHEYPEEEGGQHSAEVSFTRENDFSHSQKNDMTTGESAKVFSTVGKIMKQHAESNPSVSHFEFTSDKQIEPSRQSLYKRFTSKLGGSTENEGNYNNHVIPTKNL